VVVHALGCAVLFSPGGPWDRAARAADLGNVDGSPLALDVTETTVVARHFDARGNERPEDSGWGDWMNRLNVALRWGAWSAGLRLDSAVYWRRPVDNPDFPHLSAPAQNGIRIDNESRYENSIYPAKIWATYSTPGIEVTAGDAYAQFGRGLVLSLRKIDELGIDTTVRGAKIQLQKDPFALTLVAGFGNPSRVDEASGRSLFPLHDLRPGDRLQATFGSDRMVGLDLQAGRGLPVTASTHFVRFTRCAPYHNDVFGNSETSFGSSPGPVLFGSCDPNDTLLWLQQIGGTPPSLNASEITMVGQSLEVPDLWGHGSLYVEAAGQQRHHDTPGIDPNASGNALYGALSLGTNRVNATLEVKSNRNFYVVPASVDPFHAKEFSVVAYSFVPPAETFNMIDTEGTGDFNACVDGGRLRTDVTVSPNVLVYGQGIFARSKSEQPGAGCDAQGHTRANQPPAKVHDIVWDGIAGVELYFDDKLSHLFAWAGARDDSLEDGDVGYREQHIEYSFAKYLGHAWSLEVQGRHRHRRGPQNPGPDGTPQWWNEGENYVALRLAPKWAFTQGFEYTTQVGQPTYYVNGAILINWTASSNVRLFVGQQRGAFRCASGICRFFPPFEGARAEVTLRF
jgi:hypothetical protein